MAKVRFTEEQQKVIDTRNRNLLVSAAAGSGKTAVLVERIIAMVTDEDNPIPLDRLLVVTFTNAAASEMRERIASALEKKVYEKPRNKYLHRQLSLLPNANILTIHAFCLRVIKEHFNSINIDPSFRIGDEIELTLIKNDVIAELLEEKYEEKDEAFINLIESYAGGKSDQIIEELIKKMYQFSVSSPWPEQWLENMVNDLNITSLESLNQASWYKGSVRNNEKRLRYVMKILNDAKGICYEEGGPAHYLEPIDSYLTQIESILENITVDYNLTKEVFDNFVIPKLSAKRKGIDKGLKEKAKALIDRSKEVILKMKEAYYVFSLEEQINDLQNVYKSMTTLKTLVMAYSDRFKVVKEEKNLIDFNDIEHFALDILLEKGEDGQMKPSKVADEYMDYFEEVLIDEYQDSNLVQESILNAVSKIRVDRPNMFMVGDVKQSIYKFRMARPELFMEKYSEYSEADSLYQLICLHKNFRSRLEVLDSINYIFSAIMSKDLGDVEYDQSVALYLGASYETLEESDNSTEVIIVDKATEDNNKEVTNKEYEARVIGTQIQTLLNSGYKVYDKAIDDYREATYKDIVILLRTTSKWVEVFIRELSNMSIPVYSNTTTGYFETLEIQTIMNLLRIIDNPRQDIPLVSVLRSPVIGLTSEELAIIRMYFEEAEYYEALMMYIDTAIDSPLANKLGDFILKLDKWREMATYTPINELIYSIYEETNYYNYVLLMPRGKQRQGNLDMFIDKAIAFQKSSYSGLFNFIRYIENIKKYSVDLGEASIVSENDNLVRIMSIHKSKGLEFPIVFLAGLSKQFNMTDLRASVVFHQELGIGANYINKDDRYKIQTGPKLAIIDRLKIESLSEELRILYVALTRAREKLILIGTINDIEKNASKWCSSIYEEGSRISSMALESSTNYLDFIMPAIVRHRDGEVIRDYVDKELIETNIIIGGKERFNIEVINGNDLLETDIELTKENDIIDILNSWKQEDIDIEETIVNKLLWKYPFDELVQQKVNLSVSDIKRMHQEEVMFDKKQIAIRPEFITQETVLTSAQKGTAFHKAMSLLDITMTGEKNVNSFLDQLVNRNILTVKERESIDDYAIVNFLNSSLCSRMRATSETLKRETPFVLGIDISEINNNVDIAIDDQVMIQGVIDAYFEEEGDIVLIDYKTDYIRKGQQKLLIDRYAQQMMYYKRALEQICDKKVKEIIIYATSISEEIKM